MKTFAIVLSILIAVSSSAFAQTEAAPDTVSILVKVWIADNLSSIIISAAGREDSCAVSGYGRFTWRINPKGSIAFLFPIYNKQDADFIEHYLPGLDYRRYLACCLVLENSDNENSVNVYSIYPLEFSFLSDSQQIRWRSEEAIYIYSCFYLNGKGVEIFDFSSSLQAQIKEQGKEEDY